MASPDFFLCVSFSGVPAPAAEVLHEVVSRALAHAGSPKERTAAVAAGVEEAVRGAGPAACDVSFAARGGSLDVLVSSNGSRLWQTSEHLC